MKFNFSIFFLTLLITNIAFSQKCHHASEVRTLYRQLEANGFDLKQKINYQYFFLDENQQDLQKLKDVLQQKGFRYISFSKASGKNILQVEKNEAHNAESMLNLGKEMNLLAKANNVETFDGFEIKMEDEEDVSFNNEIEKVPHNQLFRKGIEYYDKNDNEKAMQVFDRCIKLNINSETALFKRANCKSSLGDFQGAITDFEQVLSRNPNHFESNFNIGGLFLDAKNYSKAIEFYKKAVILNPKSDDGFYRLAEAFQKTNQKSLALQNCQKSLQINPNNAFAKELMAKLK